MITLLAFAFLAAPTQAKTVPQDPPAASVQCITLMTELAAIAATASEPIDDEPERAAIGIAAIAAGNAARAVGGMAGGIAAEVINAERASAIAALEEARMAAGDAVDARVDEVERRYVAAKCDAG